MFEQTFKNIDNVLPNEAGCTTELDYTEQTSWMLFLKYLDDLEHEKALQAELVGKPYSFIIDDAHRWSRWAAPKNADGSFDHDTAMTGDDLLLIAGRMSATSSSEPTVSQALRPEISRGISHFTIGTMQSCRRCCSCDRIAVITTATSKTANGTFSPYRVA